jgi:hypothetical protein
MQLGLQAVAADCMAMGARTLIMPTDITDAQQCRHLVETTVQPTGQLGHFDQQRRGIGACLV